MDGGTDARRITIHRPEDFAGMRAAGKLAAETLDMIAPHVRPGITTGELDRICHDFMLANGAVSASLGYRGFPKSTCISINHVVCHGIPGERRLVDGDMLNIDITVILDGWYGDSSRMYVAGQASTRARVLMDVTYEALMRGVRGDPARGRRSAISATRSRATWRASASRWCGISAATASAGASTRRRTSCISAARARARC